MLNFPMELPVPPTENDPTPKKGRHRFETNFGPAREAAPCALRDRFLAEREAGSSSQGAPTGPPNRGQHSSQSGEEA